MTRQAKDPLNPSKRGGDRRNGRDWSSLPKVRGNVINFTDNIPESDKIDLKDLYSASGPYTPEQKLQGAMAYVVTGTLTAAAKLTGVPENTMKYWKNSAPWWPETIAKLRKTKQDELDGQITGVIHKAIGEVEDRVVNGDEVLDKNGNMHRKKMGGKEMATTLAILFDKRQMLRGDPTSRTDKTTTAEQLSSIMQEFKQLAADIKSRQEKDVISEVL